jgi:hypothetical protein
LLANMRGMQPHGHHCDKLRRDEKVHGVVFISNLAYSSGRVGDINKPGL